MKTKIKQLLIFLIVFTLFSCMSEREKSKRAINKESNNIMTGVLVDISISKSKINTDSLMSVYTKISSDSAELGLEYAKKLRITARAIRDSFNLIQEEIDKAKQDSIVKAAAIEQRKWNNSRAGKIQKKHPDWTNEECENIANNKVWIGMSLDMLKYERGIPNRANPSNYGNGVQWQWCWDNYTPSCFYGGENGIITSYN